jgi:hypothetical protein
VSVVWKWVDDNKTWLITGGGLTALATLISSLWRWLVTPKLALAARSEPHDAPAARQGATAHSMAADRHGPGAIVAALARLPLLQQKLVADGYLGLGVTWSGLLVDITQEGQELRFLITTRATHGDSPMGIAFAVPRFPGCLTLERDTAITVRGKIGLVNVNARHFQLFDAEIIDSPLGAVNVSAAALPA